MILTVLVLGINLNTLGRHIVLDDRIIIAGNEHLKSWDYVGEYFTKNFCEGVDWKCAYYRPMVAVSYLLDHTLWGENFFGYHLTNLMIHLLVVLALYGVFHFVFQNSRHGAGHTLNDETSTLSPLPHRGGGKGGGIPFFSALFFAAHPVHTESVAWLSARTDPLAGLFVLMSFGCYCGYLRIRQGEIGLAGFPFKNFIALRYRNLLVFYFSSLGFFMVSLLTKEIAVMLPLLSMAYESVFGKGGEMTGPSMKSTRYSLPAETPETADQRTPRLFPVRRVVPYLPFFGIIGAYLIVRQWALGYLVLGEHVDRGLWERWTTIPVIVWDYFRMIVFPYPLFIFRPSPIIGDPFHPQVVFGFFFLGAFLVGMFLFRRRFKVPVFGVLWFSISLLPFLFVVAFSELGPDERFSYIPSMGIALIFGTVAHRVFSGFSLSGEPLVQKWGKGVLAGILVVFSVMTVFRNQAWRDEIVLWKGHYHHVPDSPAGHSNLGEIYLERGDLESALDEYRKHTEFFPDKPLGYHYMGLVYQQMGKLDQALVNYNRALDTGAADKLTFYNMGLIYADRKRYDRAAKLFQLSLSIDPSYFWSHYALGEVLKDLGDWKGAVRHYEKALTLRPERGDVHLPISEVYEILGENEKAKKHYELFLQFSQNGNIKKG